jgi:hypothetical protein
MLSTFTTGRRATLKGVREVTVGPINVWIGKSDGYVYRETVSVSVSATVPAQSGSWGMRVDFSKFNEPVSVSVPPASETADMSSLGG